jgi:hypothetical protein
MGGIALIVTIPLTKAPLPASTSFTQDYRDRYQDARPVEAVAGFAFANQAGTLYLEESNDASSWTTIRTVAVAASTPADLLWTPITKRYYRFRYANGATAQTAFLLTQMIREVSKKQNVSGALLASAARTATLSSSDQLNLTGKSLRIHLKVTASASTPSIVLKIEGKNAAGVYYTILEGAAVTGASDNMYVVAPWAQNVANVSVADILPREWRVTITHADGDSITYGVYFDADQ